MPYMGGVIEISEEAIIDNLKSGGDANAASLNANPHIAVRRSRKADCGWDWWSILRDCLASTKPFLIQIRKEKGGRRELGIVHARDDESGCAGDPAQSEREAPNQPLHVGPHRPAAQHP